MDNMLYIRTDGNAEIGTGHVMRCLSIASAVSKSACECVFITADNQMKPLIEEQGFSIICLDSSWNNLDKEIKQMEDVIIKRNIKNLLVDSYFVTATYLSALQNLVHLIYIDDINKFIYPCNVLINYNIYSGNMNYPARYPNTKLLLGPKYVPLREEFQSLPARKIRQIAESVLITTGGTDELNIAGQIIEKVNQCSQTSSLHYHIIVGRFNKHTDKLKSLAMKYSNITIHQDVKNMSKLMLDCDVAISAGGTTLYELCACSMPAIIFSMADNQLMANSEFSNGYMLSCGDVSINFNKCLNEICANLTRLIDDYDLRCKMADSCWNLVNPRSTLNLI